MRQSVEKNKTKHHAPLAPPAAPKAIYWNPPHLNHNNQSEQEKNLTASFSSPSWII